ARHGGARRPRWGGRGAGRAPRWWPCSGVHGAWWRRSSARAAPMSRDPEPQAAEKSVPAARPSTAGVIFLASVIYYLLAVSIFASAQGFSGLYSFLAPPPSPP